MPEYKCSGCDYNTYIKCHMGDHINRKNKCSVDELNIIEIDSDFNCEYCKKTFSIRSNLNRHLKTCKVKKQNLEKELDKQKNNEIEEKYKKLLLEKYKKLLSEKNEKIKSIEEKLENTINNVSKLIDKKILGNVSVETIRSQARKLYKSKFPDMKCVHCKHPGSTQVCHIKAISEFDNFSLVSDINNLKNLIGLCPNCHIDLDKHKKFEVTRTATLHSMFVRRIK
jgi:5-methylcytosine-specific restriction endonuclease McrA